MKYLVVDALFNGTGIRDYYTGDYLKPETLNLEAVTTIKIHDWLFRYKSEHHKGYINDDVINELDREGREIALKIKNELLEVKIEYYSDARMTREIML